MSDSLLIREVILRDFEALIAFCESLLSDAKEKFPNRVRSAELMLRARNLIRRACGEGSEHYRVLLELARIDQPAAYVPRLQGVLLAAASDFGEGRFFEFRHVIEAEVLGSFIDQAETLLAVGHHLPAASLTGAVLERALRKLCEARGVIPPSASTIDPVNKLEASDARNNTTDAISSGWPTRPMGVISSHTLYISGLSLMPNDVSGVSI